MVSTNIPARRWLPRAAPHAGARAKSGEWAIIVCLMLIGLIAHGLNMFNYPAFTFNGDECATNCFGKHRRGENADTLHGGQRGERNSHEPSGEHRWTKWRCPGPSYRSWREACARR